jgi:hypothetical protein
MYLLDTYKLLPYQNDIPFCVQENDIQAQHVQLKAKTW